MVAAVLQNDAYDDDESNDCYYDDQPRSTQISPGQPRSVQTSPDHAKSAQIRTNLQRSARICQDQPRPAQISPDRSRSAHGCSECERGETPAGHSPPYSRKPLATTPSPDPCSIKPPPRSRRGMLQTTVRPTEGLGDGSERVNRSNKKNTVTGVSGRVRDKHRNHDLTGIWRRLFSFFFRFRNWNRLVY